MSEHVTLRDRVAGFTLIEIVMVLVLLGILAAVAVPKYFDLQAESEEKTCRYNQSVALDTIYVRFAASRIDDGTNFTFDASSKNAAAASAQAIVEELAANQKDKKLCPSGGTVTADASVSDDTYVFSVNCSIHGVTSNTSGSTGTKVTRENAGEIMGNWIQLNYQLSQKWSDKENDPNSDMDAFFTKYDQGRGAIDSEAGYDGTMTDAINKALAQAGLNSNDVIWKLERAKGDPYDAAGNKLSSWRDSKVDHYETDLILTVANKNDIDKSTSSVSASVYTMHVTYGSKNDREKEKIASVGKAELTETKTVDVRNVTTGGNTYMALKTGNGSDSDNYPSSKLQ